MKPELITAYTLSHGHFTVIPHNLEENFKDMADMGYNAAALSFSESEWAYSRRAFEIQVDLAHKQGLKVFVVPSRLGGRFAGAPLMPGLWITKHPEAQIPNHMGFAGPIACLEDRGFREWIFKFMENLLNDYPLDGVIWDEPKYERQISKHPATIAKYGENPTPEQMEDGCVDFIQDLTAHCLKLKPNLTFTMFRTKNATPRFTQNTCFIKGIDYFGYDGNLSRLSFFHEEPFWYKYRIETVWERTVSECQAANKKTFAQIENMLMPKEAIPEYEQNLENFLQTYHPDHLSIYYYAHNNEDPETVEQINRKLMKKYLK